MAGKDERQGKDAFIGLSFWVEIDGVEVASFDECSAITMETETYEYSEGGLNTHTHKLPVRTKYANITLKRGKRLCDSRGDKMDLHQVRKEFTKFSSATHKAQGEAMIEDPNVTI